MKLQLPISIAALTLAWFASDSPSQKKGPVNFGRDVRPILSEHCFKCHGPDAAKAAGGLRLDSFEAATKAAIKAGKPKDSHLIARVTDADPESRMPPPGGGTPLTQAQIQTLKDWISEGARYDTHWAFVPPKMPALPVGRSSNPIDRFVFAKLTENNLTPEPEADRDTLAMRAAQTLTGLPPSPLELKAFREDNQPGAYERFVDRLLAKPSFGEQSARYWLDAVRYGDTHGLQLDNERAVFPYRDWVVRAFNQDLPFNRFVEWQLAGDLLPNPTTEQRIATGYVRMNLTSNEGGAIAEEFLARNTFDRVDTTSTVLLGLTVGCAKCHDHKYDPIKQSEYYGLYAYFNSTRDEPLDGNISLPPPVLQAPTPDQERQLNEIKSRAKKLASKANLGDAVRWLETVSAQVPTSRDWKISPIYSEANFAAAFTKSAPGEPGQPDPSSWKPFPFELGKDANDFIRKDNSFVYVKGVVTVSRAGTTELLVGSDDGVRLWLNGKLIHSNKISRGLNQGSDKVRGEFKLGDNEIVAKVVNGASFDGLRISIGNESASKQLLAKLRAASSSPKVLDEVGRLYLLSGPESELSKAFRAVNKEQALFESSLPMTLVAEEMPKPRPAFVLKRGLYDQKGAQVGRMIPRSLGILPAKAPNNRLGLAQWMIDPKNPLVARVFVNRVWQQHFGHGIVKTAEDFGSQGEWPVNQSLLDYLSVRFMSESWSVKKLNRLIVTSAAFKQSSKVTAKKLSADPENRLISRGPRFRLDAEVIRDKALYAGGLLIDQIGGRGFKPYQPDGLWEGSSDPASSTHFYVRDKGRDLYRKSLYLFWKRSSPPPMMMTLDAPSRDACVVKRSTTNTPLQALILLNEPAFLEASRSMAVRVLRKPGSDRNRLLTLFDLTLGRRPNESEVLLLQKSLERYREMFRVSPTRAKTMLAVGDLPQSKLYPESEQASWMIVCSSLMNTDEFLSQH